MSWTSFSLQEIFNQIFDNVSLAFRVIQAVSSIADGSGNITVGGTAQALFTPSNGFAIYNPDPTNDLWISISTTAVANGQGSIRIAANGGGYESPIAAKIASSVSIIGAVTGQKFSAFKW